MRMYSMMEMSTAKTTGEGRTWDAFTMHTVKDTNWICIHVLGLERRVGRQSKILNSAPAEPDVTVCPRVFSGFPPLFKVSGQLTEAQGTTSSGGALSHQPLLQIYESICSVEPMLRSKSEIPDCLCVPVVQFRKRNTGTCEI